MECGAFQVLAPDAHGSTPRGALERQPDRSLPSSFVAAPRTLAACAPSPPGVTWRQTWPETAVGASLRARPAAPRSCGACLSAARAPVLPAPTSFRWRRRRSPWPCGQVSALGRGRVNHGKVSPGKQRQQREGTRRGPGPRKQSTRPLCTDRYLCYLFNRGKIYVT